LRKGSAVITAAIWPVASGESMGFWDRTRPGLASAMAGRL
jgi:hypothetical protein